MDQGIARSDRQQEDRSGPQDVGPEAGDDLRQLVAKQSAQRVAEVPRRLVKRGVRLSIGRLEVLAIRGRWASGSGSGEITGQQPVSVCQERGILAVFRAAFGQAPRPLGSRPPAGCAPGQGLGRSRVRAVINQHRACGEIADAHMLARSKRGGEPHSVQQGEAVDHPEHVADQQGCSARSTAVAVNQPHTRDPLARGASAQRHLEHGVIQEEEGRGRGDHENEPGRIGHQRLGQAPAPVVRKRAHHVPADGDHRPDGPVGEEGKGAHPGPRHRQQHLHSGDAVDTQVRQGLHHSSAASSSA